MQRFVNLLFLFAYYQSNQGDWLEVYDGVDQKASLIGDRLCGNKDWASHIPKVIDSTANELFIRFHSDDTTPHGGFQLKVDTGTYIHILVQCQPYFKIKIALYIALLQYISL